MAKKRRLRKTGGLTQAAPQVEEAAAPAPEKVEEVAEAPAPAKEKPKPKKDPSGWLVRKNLKHDSFTLLWLQILLTLYMLGKFTGATYRRFLKNQNLCHGFLID